MDLRTRLIAPSFLTLDSNKRIFDFDSLLKRIILFETYIIDSEGLAEIPHLIRLFGFDGFLAILESGAVKLNCFVKTTASLGSNYFINEPPSNKIRPPMHYSFVETSTGNLYYNLNLSFKRIEPEINVSSRQLVRLRRAIYSALENPKEDENNFSIKSTKNDLVLYPDLLSKALTIAIKNQFNAQIDFQDINVDVQYETEHDFHVNSNIQKLADFDISTTHKIIEKACLAIAKRNDRIEKMRAYSALSGFNDIDIPIFGEKLDFLASAINPNVDEKRFQRVIELTGLPAIKDDQNVNIDAKQLLKIRDSVECIEFRQWLATTDALSDAEVIGQVRSLSKNIGRIFGSETGQNIRFLITNGIGYVPVIGPLVSIPLSILDHFLLEKIFPRSGISAFVDEMYPSIFENS